MRALLNILSAVALGGGTRALWPFMARVGGGGGGQQTEITELYRERERTQNFTHEEREREREREFRTSHMKRERERERTLLCPQTAAMCGYGWLF